MEKMHSLLKRQIKKHLGSEKDIPESWRGLINAVNEAYLQMDIDREMLERSLELSSQELLQANSEMRAVFQAFPDLLVRTSYQGIVLDYQKSDATEFPFLGGKVIGNHIRDIFPKKDSKKLDEAIRQVTGTRALEDIEYTMEEEDREYFYEARLLPLLESEIVILIRDITTRRKAEEALKSSEEMYRILAENAPMGIYYSDFYGTFLYGNKRAEQIVGFRREELIGKNFLNLHLLNPRDLARAAKLLILNRTGKATGPDEFTLNRKDSTQVIVEIYTALITIKGRRVVLGMVHDITERKRVEEAFLTQRERFVTLIQNAPIGIVLIDPDGTFSYINPKFTEILGYDLDDVPHEREWFRKVYPDAALRQKVIDTWLFERDASRPGEGWPRTFSITCKDGTKKTINFIPVKLESGELLMTCEDISERRKLELQLLQAQKMEAIGTMAGGIAHDFNNILAAIIGYTEMALITTREELPQNNLHQVLKACERAKNLVNQILTFSREAEHERKPVELGMVIQEAFKLLRASLPATVEIRHEIPATHTMVYADDTQIHQILVNLCTNAAYAMRDEGGIIEVSLSNIEISTDVSSLNPDLTPGNYVLLTVSDNGHGIDPAILERIFDPFFTTKKAGEGTGLGLSVVYGIVRRHHGAIQVQSEPGKGTTFSIYLPCIEADSIQDKTSPVTIHGGNESVLFVDDEVALTELGEMMLTSLGYKVITQTSSVEALNVFLEKPNQFDIVITDMTMPHMTGIKLAKKIMEIRPEIPVILCTGFSEVISEEESMRQGIRKFLTKPISMSTLSVAIRDVLKSKE